MYQPLTLRTILYLQGSLLKTRIEDKVVSLHSRDEVAKALIAWGVIMEYVRYQSLADIKREKGRQMGPGLLYKKRLILRARL